MREKVRSRTRSIYYLLVLVCRKYGGYDNASTDCETTNFYFEIPRYVFFTLYLMHTVIYRGSVNEVAPPRLAGGGGVQ